MRFSVAILITIIAYSKCETSERTNEKETEQVQVNIKTAQTDDNCTPIFSNLTITPSSEELNITWDANSLEKCNFQYRINIREVSRTKSNIHSNVTNTTFYLFKNIKPCTIYNITVELFQNGNSNILPDLTESYETDTIAFNQIEKLNISTTTSAIWLSWKAHKYAHVCKIRYIITANKEIPYFRYVNSTEHWIKNLHSCTEYNVSVIPSSRLRSEFDDKSTHFMHQITTLPERVNNLTLNVNNNISMITWIPPDNNKCIKEYQITINGTVFNKITNPYLDSSENLYCTEIKIEPISNNNDIGAAVRILKPGPVKNFNTTATKTSITAFWEQPVNDGCVKDYLLELVGVDANKDHKNFTTTSLNHTFDSLTSCSKYEITVAVRSSIGTYGEFTPSYISTEETKPGPVKNLFTEATETSITASWEEPENCECVDEYLVELIGSDGVKTNNTKLLTYTFDDLKSCSTYEVKVTAISFDGISGEDNSNHISTSEPRELGPVEKFTVNNDNNLVTATWEVPLNTEACGIIYVLKVLDYKDEEIYTDNTTETYLKISFDSWIGCMSYTISITPTLPSRDGQSTKEPIQFSIVTNPPRCEESEVNGTSAVLKCELDDYETNMCTINKIIINCEAELENNSSWIIRNATASQDIKDDNRLPIHVTIKNISEFTNYICNGVVVNSAGNSPESEPVNFMTEEGVPDAPVDLKVTPTNKTLYIKWEKPEKIPGIQQNYILRIKSNGPQYFKPKDEKCKPRGEKEFYEYEVEPSKNEYDFVEAFPSFEYEVKIKASTHAGFGPESKATIQTNPGIPDEPRNIDYIISNKTTIEDYDANVTLTWMFPCYTNGKIQHFEVDVLGIPYADLDKNNETLNYIVPINEPIKNLDYEYTILGLKPAFNYTVYIKTVAEDDLKSDIPPLNFSSPESYPKAPVIKSEPQVTENAFTLEWDEPSQKNGIILSYNIIVKTIKSLYWVPPGCFRENESLPFNIPPTETSFTYLNAEPYHQYVAFMSASTSIGEGETNETPGIKTLPSEPEPVREFLANPTNATAEKYNAQVLISFKHPCKIYGSFKHFNVTLHGNRSNFLYEESIIETAKEENYGLMFDLRAEHEYVLKVQVQTESHSITTEKKFRSPSGVPPSVTKDVQAPVPDGATQAYFTFDCNLFDEEYGTIIYYALILGEINYEEKSRYGFWSGSDDTWPPIGNTFAKEMQIQPYQATPIFWNPFEDGNCYNYTFVLGDDSEFNKPLQDGITYTLKVRGFTQHGYRDTPTMTFFIPALTNLALILGLLFGLLGTGILLGFVFILWRKRKQWEMKKESIKSIPFTPIPVSIKQFSEYYNELKGNSDRLKQEFTFLCNKSSELILPSYDGILPENKKKNRYTNIIPYDETRVKLMDTNDNYSITDYINASYIQGYSGITEYIATQGPLEQTCMDFWKMVIQENASLIVMVAQFVELNKDKCYKYFPNNHENMELENGIAIRCCTELDFKTHIVRTLLIQKDMQQWTVTHLQFMEWPDFGCPTGTEVILEFCQIMREHAERNSDPIIIHCSAGVGRTGTLIALDIVLQAISYKRDIDIFGTVLNLRRDRKNMVQTEKQYLYIHSCIKDAIENPLSATCVDISIEPVYENIEETKRSQSDNNIKESQF